ncbi:MAG: hypothetical protein ACYCXH_10305, partial [Bellilinea sp.]
EALAAAAANIFVQGHSFFTSKNILYWSIAFMPGNRQGDKYHTQTLRMDYFVTRTTIGDY